MSDWETVGEVYVDSGLVWLGDPCYIVPESPTPLKSWDHFLSRLENTDGEGANHWKIDHTTPLGEGIGMAITSGHGDGCYPVEVQYDMQGRVSAMRVVFIKETDNDP